MRRGNTAMTEALYRLLSWFSPAFPAGGFAHAHGLEAAALAGVVAGTAAAGSGRGAALLAYRQSFAAGLVSAGVRLVPRGQTEGQRVLCALAPAVLRSAADAAARPLADAGTATFAVDVFSMRHETQY